MARLLFVTATGAQDATRASVPFHIAANGAAAAAIDSAIVLAGDSVELLKPEVAAGVRGVGIPALADLLRACAEKRIPIHV
jgi:predicted peroxiredoxin